MLVTDLEHLSVPYFIGRQYDFNHRVIREITDFFQKQQRPGNIVYRTVFFRYQIHVLFLVNIGSYFAPENISKM